MNDVQQPTVFASGRASGDGARTLRVLLLVESSGGGTGRHVLDLAGTLAARGHDVHLLYSPLRIDEMFAARLAALRGVRRVPLSMRRSIHPSDLRAVRDVRRYLKRFGPFDVIHGHSSKGGAVARLAAAGTGCPAVYTPHGPVFIEPDLSRAKRLIYRTIEVALSWMTSRVLAVSPEERRAIIAAGLGRHRAGLVPNGVTLPDVAANRAAARRAIGLNDNAFAFGFVGRLVDGKAPEVLLEAFAIAAKQLSTDTRLVMVGGGPIEAALREQASHLGVADRVLWLGERDASSIYPAFDAFAIASRKEGLPYVVLEAMAAGLPVVATDSSGVELLVENGVNGFVVPRDDVAGFAKAMADLAGNGALAECFGRAGYERTKRFTVDAMTDGVLSTYRAIAKVRPATSHGVQVVRGPGAERLLADPAFIAEWAALQSKCPWATGFQGQPYVGTWYASYAGKFEPLLLISRGADGTLQGLLTLATSMTTGKVIVAGGLQAEYHTWLSLPELGNDFPMRAMRALRRAIPSARLTLHYLASGTPKEWLQTPEARRYCLIRRHPRPLLRLGDGSDIAKSLKKTTNKRKLKQLEKLGGGSLVFRKIVDPVEFESRFDELVRLYDFRHGAVQGSDPFCRFPGREAFHRAMMHVPGLLHFTVMEIGGRLAAAHFGVPSGGELQLGMIVHDPFLAKQSPGKFMMLLLGQMVVNEGFDRLDLTPGGDVYKERFATDHDEVHTLTVLSTPGARARTQADWRVKAFVKTWLARMGHTPFDLEAFVQRWSRRPISVTRDLLRQARSWVSGREEIVFYRQDAKALATTAAAASVESGGDVRRDAIDDLLKYADTGAGETRRSFLSDALARIEAGQHVYTVVSDGRLRGCAWAYEEPDAEAFVDTLPGFVAPAKSCVILNVRDLTGASTSAVVETLLNAALRDACASADGGQVFVAAAHRSSTAETVERRGFARYGSITRVRRFGAERHEAALPPVPVQPVAPPAPAAQQQQSKQKQPKQQNQQQQKQQQQQQQRPRGNRPVDVDRREELETTSAA